MSMYGMVFGRQPGSDDIRGLLAHASTIRWEGCRFRDAWVEQPAGEGSYRIALYTRNGGGNREHCCHDVTHPDLCECDPSAACDCYGCWITFQAPAHPLYLFSRDDGYDSTYATVYFRLPDDERWAAPLRGSAVPGEVDTDQRWHDAIDAIKVSV